MLNVLLYSNLQKEYHVSSSYVKDYLREQGYIIKTGYKYQTVVGLKPAIEEYITNLNNKPSITKIAEKYGIMRKTLSDNLKELGYEIINYQNMVKFDNTIFDSIAYKDNLINGTSICKSNNDLIYFLFNLKLLKYLNSDTLLE